MSYVQIDPPVGGSSSPVSASTITDAPRPYPYTRAEECSWHPEDVARHMSSLVGHGGVAQLLTHGWSSNRHVPSLRAQFGMNRMPGDDDNDNIASKHPCLGYMKSILSTFLEQLKEPLILMLLGSALLSIILGNTTDAISIATALCIVSLVAAVQEYRSEQALEQLANLVPHTCTVLRDGRIEENFEASMLVVGDLVLLATGE